jgi:membrane protein implicated in regulation of membrane protease activity
MAFLMVGGWVGFLTSKAGLPDIIVIALAAVSGFAALVFIAKLMQVLMNLQEDGTTNVRNALGQIGQVYIRIPAEEKGMGKVNVTVQEKLCEFDAVTEKGETIKTGEMVYVTDVRAGNVLVVEKVEES